MVRRHLLLEPGVAAVRRPVRLARPGRARRRWCPGSTSPNTSASRRCAASPSRAGLPAALRTRRLGHAQSPAKSRSSALASMPRRVVARRRGADGDSVVDGLGVRRRRCSTTRRSVARAARADALEPDGVLLGTWSAPIEPSRSLPSGWSLAIRFHSVSASAVHSTRPGCVGAVDERHGDELDPLEADVLELQADLGHLLDVRDVGGQRLGGGVEEPDQPVEAGQRAAGDHLARPSRR